MTGEPFFAGAIHGVRTWFVDDDLKLSGFGAGSTESWTPAGRPTAARCLYSSHPAPMAECECGLYALHPRRSMCDWMPDVMGVAITGIVEAWGRIELHPVGFRAELARPTVLFAPARHLVSAEYLERLSAVAIRYRATVVDLPRPEHVHEWCRLRGIGLSRETVEDSFLQGVRITLRRTRRISSDGSRLVVGVWPEQMPEPNADLNPPSSRMRVDRLPGITICKIRARGEQAEAVLEQPEFDPGRALRLATAQRSGGQHVEVWDEHGELLLGELHRPTGERVARQLQAGRVGQVRALCRTFGLRDRSRGKRWLTILIAPLLPIEVEPEVAEPPTLPGWDWFLNEPRIDP